MMTMTTSEFVLSELASLRELYFKIQLSDCSDKRGCELLSMFYDTFRVRAAYVAGTVNGSGGIKEGLELFDIQYHSFIDTMTEYRV